MAIALVQHPAAYTEYNVYSVSLTKTFSSNPVVDNVIVVTGSNRSNSTTWTVSDNYGNTYTVWNVNNLTAHNCYVAWAVVASTGASFTVTATCGGDQAQTLDIAEFSGVATVSTEDFNAKNAATLNAVTSVTGTTTAAGDLLVSSWVSGGAITLTVPPTGYTSLMTFQPANSSHASAYKLAGAAGSETVTWPDYSAIEYTRSVLVALKAGASGPTVTTAQSTRFNKQRHSFGIRR